MLVKDLAAWLQAQWEGDGDTEIRGAADLEEAGPQDLSFVSQRRAVKLAAESRAGCLIVTPGFVNDGRRTVIRSADPRAAMARAIAKLHPATRPTPGVHPTAVIAPDAALGEGVSIGALASIGAGATVGADTTIAPACVIGERVKIGARCLIHANVTIYRDVSVGDEVILHSGCVLGADGFGFVLDHGAYEKFPQIGRVEIGDRVEIGANSCVDRAALGVTIIGEGTKLDNLVHVGHNCRIGKHVVVAAQTGFSGGVMVGDYAVIGGQVGIGDKARIEPRAVLGSGSGVLSSKIVHAGQVMWGTPARPLKEYLEQLAVVSRLAKKKQAP
ncbi:MAG TPA: UDP-3-O-(3-hydroxymyristoyl)glucosamine N-acyltransferase [Bryobacteraceae bacterium]|nr:UDP-3-O-(3-hydroxymyristoyl)glucosamine N-acyltransferase [Bryobacteraceae bacterium]